jgi:type IV pilus assembly protein PilW
VKPLARNAHGGFTIVEIMVAMAIGLVVSAVVVTMFAGSSKTYKIADAVGELQETGRVAIDALQRDARIVGFRGCNSNNVQNISPLVNQITAPGAYANDFATGVVGYESTGAGWLPALPAEISPPTAPVPAALPADSDVLVMRVTSAPIALSNTMATMVADIPVMSTTGLADGDKAIVADCARATAFQITGVDGVAGTVQHSVASNSSASVLRAFGEDGSLMRFETHAYFVAPSIRNPTTQRSLWVRVNTQPPVEVVENVERMLVLYGEDTDGNFVPNKFYRANSVGNWANVVALQVSLLLRSSGDNQNDVITNYTFNGAAVTPTDRRTRRVYTATIQLRNRTL